MAQGDRTSKQEKQSGKIGVLATGSFDFSAKRAFYATFLHDVQRHVAKHGQTLRGVAEAAPVLILVHQVFGDREAQARAGNAYAFTPERIENLIAIFCGDTFAVLLDLHARGAFQADDNQAAPSALHSKPCRGGCRSRPSSSRGFPN